MTHTQRKEYDPDKKEWYTVCSCRQRNCTKGAR